jgi:hypothetical protein
MTCNCNDNESNESNATECNETCPTTCVTQTFVNNCGCNTGCGCQPGVAGTAIPYYNAAEGCEESHKRVCIQSQYVTGVSISNTFNMPACNQTAVLVIPGLQLINIGVYLWNTVYGYLKVVSFDFASSSVVVENECLEGNAVPGTTIPACTVFTIVDIPNLAVNACENSIVDSGSLMVCSGGIMHPLDGAEIGQIPVLTDPVNNIVSFQNIDIPTRICEELTIDLTLIAGNAGPYVLTVTDTATFAPGNVLQIGGRTDRFTVVLVTAPTTFTATVDPLPGNEVIPATTPVCHIGCCEQIDLDLGDEITNITNIFNNYVADPCSWDLDARFGHAGAGATGGLTGPDSVYVGSAVPLAGVALPTLHNTLCVNSRYYVFVSYRVHGNCVITTDLSHWARLRLIPKFAWTTGLIGAAPAPVPAALFDWDDYLVYNSGAFIQPMAKTYTYSKMYILGVIPGNELKMSAQLTVEMPVSSTSNNVVSYIVQSIRLQIDAFEASY